jgi:hypothetical protein
MKVQYIFEKSGTEQPIDGYSAHATVGEPYPILAAMFNWRKEDATSWAEIIADIQLILKTSSGQNIYTADPNLYQGKYNIEQDEGRKRVQVSWGSYNDIQPVEIISTREITTVKDWDAQTTFQFKTILILKLVQKWHQFLQSEKTQRKGYCSFY